MCVALPSLGSTAARSPEPLARLFSSWQVTYALEVFPDPGAPAIASRYLYTLGEIKSTARSCAGHNGTALQTQVRKAIWQWAICLSKWVNTLPCYREGIAQISFWKSILVHIPWSKYLWSALSFPTIFSMRSACCCKTLSRLSETSWVRSAGCSRQVSVNSKELRQANATRQQQAE